MIPINRAIRFTLSLFVLILTSCDGETKLGLDAVAEAPPSSRALVSSFPANGQLGVPESARLVLEFEDNGGIPSLRLLDIAADSPVSLKLIEDKAGRTVFEMENLRPGTSYRLFMGATRDAEMTVIDFDTESHSTTISQAPQLTGNSIDSTPFPLTDHSSYHLTFSEWLDPASINEGSVRLSSASGEHPVRVAVDRQNMSIAPESPLPNIGPWTLNVSGFYDQTGMPMASFQRQFEVTPLGELTRLNIDTNSTAGSESTTIITSGLLGDFNLDFGAATGVYLGDPITFDGYQAVLIKRGSEFTGSELNVKLGGATETSLDTGPLRLTVLNDSVGYLQKNPLTDSFDSPQSVELILDLGISTSEARTQSIITQSALGVNMVGLSRIGNRKLEFTLRGTTALRIFESARVDANLEFSLNTTDLQTADYADFQGPSVIATKPFNGAIGIQPDLPIVIIFDEAIDVKSLDGRISLTNTNNVPVSIDWYSNAGRVTIVPRSKLAGQADYRLSIDSGITDIIGNSSSTSYTAQFKTQRDPASFTTAPRIQGLIPGVACQLVGADLRAGIAGHCKLQQDGSRAQAYRVFPHPANQPIELWLNSAPQAAGTYAATSCTEVAPIAVRRVDWSTGTPRCLSVVPGRLVTSGTNLRFSPDRDLQVGANYQLVIHAGADDRCDNSELCGTNGKPLDVDPFDSELRSGGEDIVIPFNVVAAGKKDTYSPLLSANRTDINANEKLDSFENAARGSSLALKLDLCDANECTNPFQTPLETLVSTTETDANAPVAGFAFDQSTHNDANGFFNFAIPLFDAIQRPIDTIVDLVVAPIVDIFTSNGEDAPCAYPGAVSTSPAYSCNPDSPRTDAFLKTRLLGDGITYSDAVFPTTIGIPEADPMTGMPRIPVMVPPTIQYTTGNTLEIEAFFDIPVETGPIIFRFRQDNDIKPGSPTIAYITTDPANPEESRFQITLDVYVDAPQLTVPTGGSQDLRNRELTVDFSGPLTFTTQGQFKLELTNDKTIKLPVKISQTLLGVANGDVVLEVPQGEFKLDLLSN